MADSSELLYALSSETNYSNLTSKLNLFFKKSGYQFPVTKVIAGTIAEKFPTTGIMLRAVIILD